MTKAAGKPERERIIKAIADKHGIVDLLGPPDAPTWALDALNEAYDAGAQSGDGTGADDLWLQYISPCNLCSLCGNRGLIDTRGVRSPAGVECGAINYCLCPNGQALRKAGYSLAPDSQRLNDSVAGSDSPEQGKPPDARIVRMLELRAKFHSDHHLTEEESNEFDSLFDAVWCGAASSQGATSEPEGEVNE